MENLVQDLVYAVRTLRKSPLFVVVSALTLAFGIGVNTTIFNFVNALLLRPLPVSNPEELVEIYTSGSSGETYSTSSYPDYVDLRDQNEVFSGLAGYSMMFASLQHEGRSEIIFGEVVTGNYWEVMGVSAMVGRAFGPEDDLTPGAHPVVVLGNSFWQERFGGDTGVLGSVLRLNGTGYNILGVAPPSFTGVVPGLAADLWIPSMMVLEVEPVGRIDTVRSPTGTNRLERRGNRWMFMKGRLEPGVSLEQARANATTVMARLVETYPDTNEDRKLRLIRAGNVRFHPDLDSNLTPAAGVLMVLVALVLLIACANLANMLLSRASGRQREISIRLALGASRKRLIRQLLTESVLLALLGGLLAWVLAGWTTRLILAYQPPIPFSLTLDLGLDVRVLVFTSLLALASAVAFGLAPALQASKPNLVEGLKEGSRSAGGGARRWFSMRNVLVVVQVAVAVVLLISAALLGRSLVSAREIDVGFAPREVAVLSMNLGMHGYEGEQVEIFLDRLLERVQGKPGVKSASYASRLPFSLNVHQTRVFIKGHQESADDAGFAIDSTEVEPGYFETMGIPLRQGRDLAGTDTADTPRVAIINETMARRYWKDVDPIGRRLRLNSFDGPEAEVVGICADHKVRSVGEKPRSMLHLARAQRPSPAVNLVVRGTSGDGGTLLEGLRRAALELEPEMAFGASTTVEGMMSVSLFPVLMGAALVGLFGALALLLAALGLYGVIAFTASQRDREMGIRVALGASSRDVLLLVIRQGMTLAGIGAAIGALLAALGSGALKGVLYGISALDAVAFGGSLLVLLSVAFTANLVPAWRASRVDPQIVLREE